MDWLAVVPWIAPEWNLRAFLDGVEVDLIQHFLFVDNSANSELRNWRLEVRRAEVIYAPDNVGVPKAWNEGLRRGHEQTILCSASVRFPAGMRQFLRELEAHATRWGSRTPLSWHLVAIGRATVEKVGYFDENCYPGDWSDNDFGWRMMQANIHARSQGEQPPPDGCIAPPVPMSCATAGYNIAIQTGAFRDNSRAVEEYYRQKWGGQPAVWDRPWNDANNDLSYWPPASVAELKQRYGL